MNTSTVERIPEGKTRLKARWSNRAACPSLTVQPLTASGIIYNVQLVCDEKNILTVSMQPKKHEMPAISQHGGTPKPRKPLTLLLSTTKPASPAPAAKAPTFPPPPSPFAAALGPRQPPTPPHSYQTPRRLTSLLHTCLLLVVQLLLLMGKPPPTHLPPVPPGSRHAHRRPATPGTEGRW